MISGTVTTVYETLTTTTQIPTVIPDPHQSPPPPSHDWPNRSGHLQTWQITTIVIAVLALFSACASVVLLGWMRKKRKEDKNKGVLGIGLEPWDEKEKRGVSVNGTQHQHQHQHVHGGAGGDQGHDGTMWQGGGPGAFGQQGHEGSGPTYPSGYPEHQRGYSSDLYAYDLSGGSGMSEADYPGLYGGLVMSPQQASMPQGGGYYRPSYDEYPEGPKYYTATQPVQYPAPPNHSNTSPNSISTPQGENRVMESMDYVDGYGHGQTSAGARNRQATGDYVDVISQRESHDGTEDSATLGWDSKWTGPGGVNLLWDDPSKDRGQKDLGARGPEGEGDLNWKVELSRKSPQALLRGEGEVVSDEGKGKGRAS
ncbi:hypothetical protein CPB97_003371 [Podila verticillata]|nr:hypothetical protein CPB97_003371 [Podila verticillata]